MQVFSRLHRIIVSLSLLVLQENEFKQREDGSKEWNFDARDDLRDVLKHEDVTCTIAEQPSQDTYLARKVTNFLGSVSCHGFHGHRRLEVVASSAEVID